MQLPYASTAGSRRAAVVSTGIKWAIVLLVILNLLQLNLLYFSSQGSTRCILKAALATRSAAEPAVARSKSDTAAATTLPGNPLGSTATGTVLQPQAIRRGRHALFVLYSWNYDALLTAARSYGRAGYSSELIILDNTSNSTLADDPVVAELAAEVMSTRTRLTFSQAQNFMADVAIERGYEYYFWGHADVAIEGEDESALLAEELRACAESAHRSHPKWGVISMNGSFFSAIRTDVMREVKYDTFVTVSLSHCDFYPRVRAAGYESLDISEICPSVAMSAQGINVSMAAPHSIGKEGLEEKRHEEVSQARRALQEGPEAPGSMGSFHFDWDLNAMPAGDRVGWELWEQASYLYLLAKWGQGGGGENACAIEVRDPISGNASLPQKPFSSLLYLQRHWYEEDPNFRNLPILAGLGRSGKRGKPERAKQAPAEADLAAAERAKASGDSGVREAAAAAKAAAGAAGVAGAAAAAGSAAASDPGGGAAKEASKEGLASAELGGPKTAGDAGVASDASGGIAAAAEGENDGAAGDFDAFSDGFDALDGAALDTYPEDTDEEAALSAELDSLEAAWGDGEEATGDLEGFEAASGDERTLADLERAEAEQELTEREGTRTDANPGVALTDSARLPSMEALQYLEDTGAGAGEGSAAAAEAHAAAELASDATASMAASKAVDDAGAASGSAAALQQPLKAAKPADGNPTQEAGSAADVESEGRPSSLERYEADLASEDASALEEDLDLPLAGGAAEEQEEWPEEGGYAGEEEDETVGDDDELWIDQRYLAGDPDDDAEDGVSESGAASTSVQDTAEREQAGLPEGTQEESLSQAGASSEPVDTVQQEGAALPGVEQPAALTAIDVTDSAVEGSKKAGQLVETGEGAVSADVMEEEELSDMDYVLDGEEDDTEINGLDSIYDEDVESGADGEVMEEDADISLAEAAV